MHSHRQTVWDSWTVITVGTEFVQNKNKTKPKKNCKYTELRSECFNENRETLYHYAKQKKETTRKYLCGDRSSVQLCVICKMLSSMFSFLSLFPFCTSLFRIFHSKPYFHYARLTLWTLTCLYTSDNVQFYFFFCSSRCICNSNPFRTGSNWVCSGHLIMYTHLK